MFIPGYFGPSNEAFTLDMQGVKTLVWRQSPRPLSAPTTRIAYNEFRFGPCDWLNEWLKGQSYVNDEQMAERVRDSQQRIAKKFGLHQSEGALWPLNSLR